MTTRTETRPKGEAIRTASGRLFWPFAPREEEILLEDVAHHLAHLGRFTGAARTFYSVAQHSVLVSTICETVLGAPEDAAEGLFHDLEEAYFNDIARPIKRRPEFAGVRAAADHLRALGFRRFGITPRPTSTVKAADDLALHAELRDLITGSDPSHIAAAQGLRAITPHRPELARHLFLDRFQDLVKRKLIR